ncbi:MAG: DUF2934 domain-containing protein [Steroidobacteraceae bacterium]
MRQLSEERVRELAYQAWQSRGCPLGTPEVDWQSALQRADADDELPDSEAAELNVDNTDIGSQVEVLSLGLEDFGK